MKIVKNTTVKITAFFCMVILLSGMFTIQARADAVPRKVKMRVSKMTVTAGETFQLRVRTTPLDADEDELVWSVVSGKNVVRFEEEDNDYDGDDMEFRAIKAGKARICCRIRGTNKKTYATITVKAPKKNSCNIKRMGKKTRMVEVGDSFELGVKKSRGVRDSHLKWYIKDRNIVKFEDDDIYDNEIELKARRVGTTQVTCQNTRTKQKVTFIINVIADTDEKEGYKYPGRDGNCKYPDRDGHCKYYEEDDD